MAIDKQVQGSWNFVCVYFIIILRELWVSVSSGKSIMDTKGSTSS